VTHATNLSLVLDEEMLGRHRVVVAPPWTPDLALSPCDDLAAQLGGRLLVKYLRKEDRRTYSGSSAVVHFPGIHHVTPTAICLSNLASVLNLPPLDPPRYALLLDPTRLEALGPRRIRGGRAIEYVLPRGFPLSAVVPPHGPIEVR
jgi:hypothetical protein